MVEGDVVAWSMRKRQLLCKARSSSQGAVQAQQVGSVINPVGSERGPQHQTGTWQMAQPSSIKIAVVVDGSGPALTVLSITRPGVDCRVTYKQWASVLHVSMSS